MLSFLISPEASYFGTFLSGVATLVAVIVAWAQFKQWRHQEVAKRKAEVAAQVMGCAIRFADGLKYLNSPWGGFQDQGDQTESRGDRFRGGFLRKIETYNADFQAYLKAWDEAEVHLSDEIVSDLDRLWKLFKKIEIEGTMNFPMLLEQGTPTQRAESHEIIFGEETRNEISALRTSLKNSLKPIARMDV